MDKSKKHLFYIFFILILFLILFFMHVLIGPIIFALLFSYLLNPVLDYLESRKVKRSYSAFFVTTLFILAVIFVVWVLFPIIYDQIMSLAKHLPEFKVYLENVLLPKVERMTADFTGQKNHKSVHVYDFVSSDKGNSIETILIQLGSSTKLVFSWLLLLVVTPVFLFFLLRDIKKIYNFMISLVPFEILPGFIDITKELDKKIKSVIIGQITVISILCVLYSSFLYIAGLPSAIAVGLLTGIARFIPYFDLVGGSFLCFFVLVTNSADNRLILSVVIAFLSVQCIDGLFITPRIMGKFSDLPPFLVLLSVICFGYWFGFYGVLLAIPSAAIGKVIVKILLDSYRKSSYFFSK